jgi:anti-sigma regulatory factor (Ser/Thr protein kinase)
VLDELLTNIIKFGHTDIQAHEIMLRLSIEGDALVAEIEDDGVPFNPMESPTPDMNAPLNERRVGGVGLHFVKNLMEVVRYDRVGDRNRLVLRRALAG